MIARFARKTETLERAKRKGVGGKKFLPALAFRRRRISYFALQNAPPTQLRLTRPTYSRATSKHQGTPFCVCEI